MTYNLDFDFAAFILLIILGIFISSRKPLPTRYNRLFLAIIVTNGLVIIYDLISSYMDMGASSFSIIFMYASNMMYFICFAVRACVTALYAESLINLNIVRQQRTLIYIPTIIYVLLVLSSPFTHWIFYVDEAGYHSGILYNTLYILAWYYIGCSLVFALYNRKNIEQHVFSGVIFYNLILASGLLIRKSLPNVLVMNGIYIIAILIMYLYMHNPEYYIDRKTGAFNKYGLREYLNDNIIKNKKLSCIGIQIYHYADIRTVYGNNIMDKCLGKISSYLIETFPKCFVTYNRDGLFLVTKSGDFKKDETIPMLEERFLLPWEVEEGSSVSLQQQIFLIPSDIPFTSYNEFSDFVYLAIREMDEPDTNMTLTQEIMEKSAEGMRLRRCVENAIDKNLVTVYFQPVYNTRTGRTDSAEALVRLIDPELGFIDPESMIRIAERDGSILRLGNQIFEKICVFIEQNDLEAMGIDHIHVNLSPVQCLDKQLPRSIFEIAEAHHVPMHQIHLEITESSVYDSGKMKQLMNTMLEMGTAFALDDYGKGYSNLIQIASLPFNTIKIDLSIVWDYFRNHSTGLLPEMVKAFKGLDFKVTAEGVETKEMVEGLTAMGVDYLQGYYFSKPVPPEEFMAYQMKQKKA